MLFLVFSVLLTIVYVAFLVYCCRRVRSSDDGFDHQLIGVFYNRLIMVVDKVFVLCFHIKTKTGVKFYKVLYLFEYIYFCVLFKFKSLYFQNFIFINTIFIFFTFVGD